VQAKKYRIESAKACYKGEKNLSYEKFGKRIEELKTEFAQFEVQFLDRDGFKKFADNLLQEISGYNKIYITGYFSEEIREPLEFFARGHRLKLLSQEFKLDQKRDQENLEVMQKLFEAGAEIKVNYRMHARFLVAHSPEFSPGYGLLVVGSFDFNKDSMSKERYDAGIRTKNPDLVAPAVRLFEQIWNEPKSVPLNEKYPER
jgi:RNA binding exosome subunit